MKPLWTLNHNRNIVMLCNTFDIGIKEDTIGAYIPNSVTLPPTTSPLWIGSSVKVGDGCHFGSNTLIGTDYHFMSVTLGDNCVVKENVRIGCSTSAPHSIKIDDNCVIGEGAIIGCSFMSVVHIGHDVSIGDYASIANGRRAKVVIGEHCQLFSSKTHPTFLALAPLTEVELGSNTQVLGPIDLANKDEAWVTIGKRAVLGNPDMTYLRLATFEGDSITLPDGVVLYVK